MIHGQRKPSLPKFKKVFKRTKHQSNLRKQISELEVLYMDLTKQIDQLNDERPEFKLIDGETYTFKDYLNYLSLDKECNTKINDLYNIRHNITMKLFDLKINLVD